MPSYLDLGLIGVVFISAILSMLRGFTREILAIASWAAAAVAAYYFHPVALPYIKPYITKDTFALAAAVGAVFLVTLIVVSIITVRISDAILDSKVGALDRSLGFFFGAARGVLCAWSPSCSSTGSCREGPARLGARGQDPSVPRADGQQLMAMLPEDPLNTLQERVNRKLREGEPPPETGAAPSGSQPPARRL